MSEVLDFDFASMDLSIPAEPSESSWLARRRLGFGCSDLPALLYLLGIRADAPSYAKAKAKRIHTKRGPIQRLFAEKLGLCREKRPGQAADLGKERERELIARWSYRLRNGDASEAESFIDAESITHADSCPSEWWPLVDRHCPALLDTPDGWARAIDGSGLVIQAKCSMQEISSLPTHWRDQVMGELAVTGCDFGVLVCGEGWAAPWWTEDGPIRVWFVQRNEDEIAQIRGAVRFGASCLESLRAA